MSCNNKYKGRIMMKIHLMLVQILGGKSSGMSDRIWDTILKHARSCNIGNKLYLSRVSNCTIILDAICNIDSINIDGQTYSTPYIEDSHKVRPVIYIDI